MNDQVIGALPRSSAPRRTVRDILASAAAARGFASERIGASLLRFQCDGRMRLVHDDAAGNDGHVSVEIARDPFLAAKLLRRADVLVPLTELVATPEDAVAVHERWSGPVAVSASDSMEAISRMPRFDDALAIRGAFARAAQHTGRVILSGPLHGKDYRVLVVDGVARSVVSCAAPSIVGDGRSTLRALIDETNAMPEAGQRTAIRCDELTDVVLARQGLALESVVTGGFRVRLREGWEPGSGGVVADLTRSIHPRVAEECARAARRIGLKVGEVAVVCRDISRSLESQGGCITGIDPSPDVGVHLSATGADVHGIGTAVLEMLFPGA
jgi:cyanophycin synthetase